MSPVLPLKEKARIRVTEIAGNLKPHFPEITAAWRSQMFAEFHLDGRAMAALERLNLGTGFALFCQSDFQIYSENLHYYGARLGKLKVDTRAVARSLEIYQECCEPILQQLFPDRAVEMVAAMEMFSSATFVAVSGAYFDAQQRASAALLSLLDAELSARSLSSLLEEALWITAQTFGASVGMVFLRDGDELRPHAAIGLNRRVSNLSGIALGQQFSGQIALTGEPGSEPELIPGAAVDHAMRGKARSLWGVPLKAGDEVIGVLTIGFAQPHKWLPSEQELLKAIADRSSLAIERARIADAVREREVRIAELSGHLLRVQEEERKRISRELHDETGQALMVIRLYLGMLESSFGGRSREKIRETIAVVDRTIEGIRRIVARLSPLVLQELGLVAAVRKEAKDLAKNAGVRVRVMIAEDVGRLQPECETAIYRVVQEALHNVAKHAQAKSVTVQIIQQDGLIRASIEDDGQGFAKSSFTGRSFGLAGIRERIGSLGGVVRVNSSRGKGTRIEVDVPFQQAWQEESDSHRLQVVGAEPSKRKNRKHGGFDLDRNRVLREATERASHPGTA